MGITRTVIICLCVALFVSCGGPKVATPSDDADIPRDGKTLTRTDKNYLQELKTENPDDYDLLYELSKGDDELMIEFIDKESKRQEIEIECFGEDGKKVENFEEFFANLPVSSNPADTVKQFYNLIKTEDFESAFEMLHPNGLEKQKYQDNVAGFVSTWRGIRSGMRQKDINIYSLSIYHVGKNPAIEATYTVWGFFAPTDIPKENPTSTLMPPMGQVKPDDKKDEGIALNEWDYRESGKASMILLPHDNKWLIYALP